MVLDDARDGTVYAALNLGHFGSKLHRSADRGATLERGGGAVVRGPARHRQAARPGRRAPPPEPPTLKMLWALEAGGADQPGRLWAGTLPGGLFKSDDRGATWTICRSLWDEPARAQWFGGGYDWPGVHSVLVDPRDSRHVVVGVSCGGAWASDDDGATWSVPRHRHARRLHAARAAGRPVIQDPHRIVRCPARPTCSGRSTTAACSARPTAAGSGRRSTPRGRRASASPWPCIPQRPDTAWFVPAVKDERRVPVDGKLVVSRTTDGGKTFDVLDRGLPAPSYDLVYRHALDVDATGNVLAMGSTTGGLWISTDGGDSWRTVSTNLPPIYAVRFGAPH